MRYEPLKKGDKVELLIADEAWATARVTEVLSQQFLCRIGKGTERFYFKQDMGVTWRPIGEVQ